MNQPHTPVSYAGGLVTNLSDWAGQGLGLGGRIWPALTRPPHKDEHCLAWLCMGVDLLSPAYSTPKVWLIQEKRINTYHSISPVNPEGKTNSIGKHGRRKCSPQSWLSLIVCAKRRLIWRTSGTLSNVKEETVFSACLSTEEASIMLMITNDC